MSPAEVCSPGQEWLFLGALGLSQVLIHDSGTTFVLTASLPQDHLQKYFKYPTDFLGNKEPKICQLHSTI